MFFLSGCNLRQIQIAFGFCCWDHLPLYFLSSFQVWWFARIHWTSTSTNLTRWSTNSMSNTSSPSCKVSALPSETAINEADWKLAVIKWTALSFSQIVFLLTRESHYIWIYPHSASASASLSGYNDSVQEKNKDCTPGEYFLQDDTTDISKVACRFKRVSLSLCSGLSDTNFGYHDGRPCVLLKLNRVTPASHDRLPFFRCPKNLFAHPHKFCSSLSRQPLISVPKINYLHTF